MASVLATIEDKYSYDENDNDYGFIVFVCNSPETKKGMLPPIMTLCDYDIETLGSSSLPLSKFSHIAELDLTDNLISDWNEVFLLLNTFPNLEFLNLSNNMLNEPLDTLENQLTKTSLVMKKFVLNGNNLEWNTINLLTEKMPQLEELYLSTNNLYNPQGDNVFQHQNLRQLFLTCNPLTDFEVISENVSCPNLELLSLAQCPISFIPEYQSRKKVLDKLISLNLSTTKIDSWEQIDKLRKFPTLNELRFQHCPVLNGLTKHEKRMMLIARLPNIKILNGGDNIPANEREDAERAFIRYFMNSEEKPARYHELIDIHGQLDPLVNISMRPDTHVTVNICHKETNREETIQVYQSVQQFKILLQQWFKVPPQNMKLYYCDKDLVELAGPEEMKWPQKALYTYNVQNGDKFILDEKVASLGKLRTRTTSNSSNLAHSPSSAKVYNSPGSKSESSLSPCTFSFMMNPKMFSNSEKSRVSRNLFGQNCKQNGSRIPRNIIPPGEQKARQNENEKNQQS